MAQTPPDETAIPAGDTAKDPLQLAYDQKLREAVAAFGLNRSVIEQAKGMLMFIYGINADQAFAQLSSQSQASNIKVRTIAERLTVEFLALPPEYRVPDTAACTEVLLRESPLGPPMGLAS
jgi:hypothetical protein